VPISWQISLGKQSWQRDDNNKSASLKKTRKSCGDLVPETQLKFTKDDRQFTLFWKEKMQVLPDDNRRHIPLVANMKAMLKNTWDQSTADQAIELRSLADRFLLEMQGQAHKGSNAQAMKKILHVLSNLTSHIFLGHGAVNQIIGSLADALDTIESNTLQKIDEADTKQDMEKILSTWRFKFEKQLTTTRQECARVLSQKDLRLLDRPHIMQHYVCQFQEVFSVLKADQYHSLQAFKDDSKALIMNLKDSYSTDISDASHHKIRRWQNSSWIPCHRQMLVCSAKPSVQRLDEVLHLVIRLETEFAALVSSELNQQGFDTKASLFLMANRSQLNAESAKPIRVALMDMLQQPGHPLYDVSSVKMPS